MFSSTVRMFMVVGACIAVFSVNAYAVKKEDPLRPPEYKLETTSVGESKKAEPTWYVNEILFSGERRVAIVNDISVVKGDHVSGARVVDIKPDYVVLIYKNKTINARLRAVSVKKQVK